MGPSNRNDLVSAYLTQYPEQLLVVDPNNEDLAPTPRAWERVSRNLDQLQALDQKMQKELAVIYLVVTWVMKKGGGLCSVCPYWGKSLQWQP